MYELISASLTKQIILVKKYEHDCLFWRFIN